MSTSPSTSPSPVLSVSARGAVRRAGAQARRDLVYLGAGLLTSILALAVWVTGVTVAASLAVLVAGIPAFLLVAVAFRWTAELDRRAAALVLGRPLRGRYAPRTGGLWTRVRATARDRQTWRDLSWLVLHSGIGFAFGCVALCLAGSVLFLASLPVWYWARDAGADHWLWPVDTLPAALATAALAVPLAALSVPVLRVMARTESRLATALLGARTT